MTLNDSTSSWEIASGSNIIGCTFNELSDAENEANAKLMAAAPAMLEFINRMASEKNFMDPEQFEEAQALVNQATA